jgi:hypothetical protein
MRSRSYRQSGRVKDARCPHVWTARGMQDYVSGSDQSGSVMCPAYMRSVGAAGPDEVRGRRANQFCALKALGAPRLHSIPGLTGSPSQLSPSFPRPTGDGRTGFPQAVAGRYTSSRLRIAHAMRAVLLAIATDTSLAGLRSSNRAIHGNEDASRRARRTTAVAPTTSNRLMVRSPCLLIRPSRSFPPLLFCRGVRPSQAANCRADLNSAASPTEAAIAAAVSEPTPGMVIKRRAAASLLHQAMIVRSNSAIF